MRLYSGTSLQFIQDSVLNQIADKLKINFFSYYQYYPSPNEVNSWRNSLRAVSQVFDHAGLDDQGVILEYQLPMTSKRLDCLICGRNGEDKDSAVIIELKQWDRCQESGGDNEVLTFVAGRSRDVLHPSVQVGGYKMYLEDTNTAFYEGNNPVGLDACAYLHNYAYDPSDILFADKFKDTLAKYPLFTADDVEKLSDFLGKKLKNGQGTEVLRRIEDSKYKPSKKLMDHVGQMIKNKKEYVLLDEQQVVYDAVLAAARKGFHDKQKSVILVRGGPGTGKSMIAINLMADLLTKGYNAHYATGSKAFTETLRKKIGLRGSVQFNYFSTYADADTNEIDVLICDEAHRMWETSFNRFAPKSTKASVPLVEELLKAAKTAVFLIDDDQVVRPLEIGSSNYILEHALRNKCKINEYELEAQFRCSGSDAFVNWVTNTLGVRRTANVLWNREEEFDFRIFDSPLTLESAVKDKISQGNTARLAAGFCWKWSDPNEDGQLEDDVVIGDFKKPWNARPNAGKLAPGIPKAQLWANDPNGVNQVGCIYTAQGFEFDYVGVIIGRDLVYNLDSGQWKGQPEHSADSVVRKSKEGFLGFVKNSYRVLLTRGMKGCYVFFQDKDTERFVRSRIQGHHT